MIQTPATSNWHLTCNSRYNDDGSKSYFHTPVTLTNCFPSSTCKLYEKNVLKEFAGLQGIIHKSIVELQSLHLFSVVVGNNLYKALLIVALD